MSGYKWQQLLSDIVPSKVEIYSPCTVIAILDSHPQETRAYVYQGHAKEGHRRNTGICQKLETIHLPSAGWKIVE